jgi:hypothetical protein
LEKKKNTWLIILIVVLSVLVVGIGGYLIYEKVFKDTTPPRIVLKGGKSLTIPINSKYEEAGYEVSDNRDKESDITRKIKGKVDTSKEGTYTIIYIATDKSGNKSQLTRTVVIERTAKEISTFEVGDIIEFSNKEWIIFYKDNNEVRLILKGYEADRVFAKDGSDRFNLENQENLLHYLNKYYLEKLDKDSIIERDYLIGKYKDEESNKLKMKVGLLTKQEFISLELEGFTEYWGTNSAGWWLLTPEGDTQSCYITCSVYSTHTIISADNKPATGSLENSYGVKPVISVIPSVKVKQINQ